MTHMIEWKQQPVPVPPATMEPRTDAYRLGTAVVAPSSVADGMLRLGTGIDGNDAGIRFRVFHGKYQGPTLVVQAGVHGDEYDGQQSVRRIFEDLDPDGLHGTVVAIPCVNESAFVPGTRVSAVDHANFNRIFPGSPTGTYSHRLADLYVRELVPAADAMVDLHTGGSFGEIAPLAIVQRGYEEIATALGLAAGFDIVWKGGAWGGTARSAFLEAGKPAVTLEYGGGGYRTDVVNTHVEALRNILRYLSMIAGEAVFRDRYTQVDATFSQATGGGFYVAESHPGDRVEKGRPLARIVDHLGAVNETISAPDDGVVVWIRRRCATNIGDEAIIFGTVDAEIVPVA